MNSLDWLKLGDQFSFTRVVTEQDHEAFAALSGDCSPIHADEAYSKNTHYGHRLAHGMFLGSWVSRLVGMELSREGSVFVCMKVSIEFKKPVYIGDSITLIGTVSTMSTSTGVVELGLLYARDGEIVAIGTAFAKLI